jgi:hypothetical protein
MRERPIIEVTFYETYYFSSVIRNILNDRFPYVRNLHDFYGDGAVLNFTAPFPKYSAFHSFVEFVVEAVYFEDLDEVKFDFIRAEEEKWGVIPSGLRSDPWLLPINRALLYHQIEHQSFKDWLSEHSIPLTEASEDDAFEYFQELRLEGPVEQLIDRTVNEVFFVMFGNRGAMALFNEMMASEMSDVTVKEEPSEFHERFKRDGVLHRAHIPSWVQNAVFFRDRGCCVLCGKNISGLVDIGSGKNFDHIVPLGNGGLNDVTNIQLLCEHCNNAKSNRHSQTSHKYETWY